MKRNIITENYKKIITESFGEDGWNDEVRETLTEVISNLESFIYEIRNCVKGSYTNAKTHSALADYIRNLSEDLTYAADEIENLPEDDEDDEDVEEESAVEMPTDTDNVITDNEAKGLKSEKYIIMCGDKYVSSPINKLTENPNLAAIFTGMDEVNTAKVQYVDSGCKLRVIPMNELFTDGEFDEDKANIYFKYNAIYESIQQKLKKTI